MKLKKTFNKGFSLIEMVIVLVILSVLGIMTSSFIKTGSDIYVHSSHLDKSISSIRFVMERLRREVTNALPNSLIVKNNCLIFTPIVASSFYGDDFPIYPITSNHGVISPINRILKGTKAVIDISSSKELLEETKTQIVKHYDSLKGKLTFGSNISFQSPSPNQRIYFIKENTSYCFNDSSLYKQSNHGDDILMAENITGKFVIKEMPSELLQVTYTIKVDQQEVFVEQILRINDKP